MKTIALIQPKIEFEENYPCSWIPFSILAVASSLPQNLFDIRIFDEQYVNAQEIRQSLKSADVLVIAVSIMTGGGQIENALKIVRLLKQDHPFAVNVFGGPHANVLPEQTAQCTEVDYVISGLGQVAFRELVEALDKNLPVEKIDGVYRREGDKVLIPKNPKATVSFLPPYRFELINPNPYIKYDSTIASRTLNYISSQGCPYGCRFCYENFYDRKYFRLKANLVEKDMRLYAEQFHVNGVKFYDADFFINRKVCDEIVFQLKDYNLAWAASIHPNDILCYQEGARNSLLNFISVNGCKRLLMGLESGNDRVLKEIINKRIDSKAYRLIAKTVADYGIIGSYTFVVGFPGETAEEYEDTFSLVEELWALQVPLETKIHIYLPYPGTPLFKEVIRLGYKPPKKLADWSSYNYYKAMTPWTDESLEEKLKWYTKMIPKGVQK